MEAIAIVGFLILVAGSLYLFAQDVYQLEQALNLNLAQTLIINQGIVNLQREVLLTRDEVVHLLGGLDDPPKPITRFDFVKIQVTHLLLDVKLPGGGSKVSPEGLILVQDIAARSAVVEQLVADWQQAGTREQQVTVLKMLDSQLDTMEADIKQLIDRQSTKQREEIVQTRASLSASQRTAFLTATVLLLMSGALVAVFRQELNSRLRRAEEADRLKSQLLANVSHELRTPLSAIKGYVELMGEGSYGALTQEQQTAIKRMLLNTIQLQSMVNNLLDQTQIEQGKITLRNTPFAPVDLIGFAQSALNILATTKGLELKSEIAVGMPSMLTGDMLRLQQILINLMSNAIKFTERGSVLTRIFQPDSTHWAMQVSDTGLGIPADSQAHIFEAFWQARTSTTQQRRGSGLGLSIVKQLADLMGGQITLISQPGQGSAFTITFPLEPKL